MLYLRLLILISYLTPSVSTLAEPWLSNRYAQNCAGCHAPGRKNVEPAKRRCSLSCQGCHVNPSGGGMRNHYGKWNENRWLRSFYVEELGNKPSTAPLSKQPYRPKAKKKKRYLRTVKEVVTDEVPYDRNNSSLDHITADNEKDFEKTIPRKDPYWLMLKDKIDVGGDLRWQAKSAHISTDVEAVKTTSEQWYSFFMSADLSVRYRPFYRKLHFVYEGRWSGNPLGASKTEEKLDTLARRSLYMMVDEIPYNLYFQAGYYTPMFGYKVPDHTALSQQVWAQAVGGSAYDLNFQTTSVGGSPNVPFANAHYISKKFADGETSDTFNGFVVNVGGRFVTLGLSLNYSYWNTSEKYSLDDLTNTVESTQIFHSFNAGIAYKDLVTNVDFLLATTSTPTSELEKNEKSGLFLTLDMYYPLWRGTYLNAMYASGDASRSLDPGSSDDMRIGLRSFLLSGMDISYMIVLENDTTVNDNGEPTKILKENGAQAQLHLYF